MYTALEPANTIYTYTAHLSCQHKAPVHINLIHGYYNLYARGKVQDSAFMQTTYLNRLSMTLVR